MIGFLKGNVFVFNIVFSPVFINISGNEFPVIMF